MLSLRAISRSREGNQVTATNQTKQPTMVRDQFEVTKVYISGKLKLQVIPETDSNHIVRKPATNNRLTN